MFEALGSVNNTNSTLNNLKSRLVLALKRHGQNQLFSEPKELLSERLTLDGRHPQERLMVA